MDETQKISFVRNVHAYVKTQAEGEHHIQPKKMPCHVSAIKDNDMIELTFDVTGPFTLPKIVVPQSFSKYHREPTQVGDPGFVTMGDFSLAGPSAAGSNGAAPTASLHLRGNLANGVFQPISNTKWPKKDPNMFLVTGGPSGHTTQSADGKTSKIIDALNNILHISSNGIIHQAEQAIAHISGQTLTQAASQINHVAQNFTFGAPSTTIVITKVATDTSAPPTIPTIPEPVEKTIMTVIGDLHATGIITTPTGSVGPGGSAGPQGPQGPPGAPIQGTLPATITGAKGGNTALASLLTALVTMGLIVDHTTS
jgi:hypothetical protein